MKCSICKQTIKGYGHNAQPLKKGRCCDICNVKVIFKRLIDLKEDAIIVFAKVSIRPTEEEAKARYKKSEKLAIEMSERAYGKNRKANLWICRRLNGEEPFQFAKKGKCSNCKASISYDPKVKHRMTTRAKKVCTDCVLKSKKYLKHLNKEQKDVIEYGILKDK